MNYDTILIPGGGLRAGGELPLWVQNRLDYAIECYQGETIIALSGGTVHRPPPLDEADFPIFEARAAANYLIQAGITGTKIIAETSSYDTIGNAYFSRVIHTEPRGFKQLLVITSAFHMPRTEAIFRWVYGLGEQGYRMVFASVADVGFMGEALAARRQRERQSLEQVMVLQPQITTMADLHQWLFTEHRAYTVSALPQRVKGQALDTY